MKKIKLSNMPLILLALSVLIFVIVILIGSLIKRLEITIVLLYFPIVFGAVSIISSLAGLFKNKYNKTYFIVMLIVNIALVGFFTFFLLTLQGLYKLT